MLTRLAIAGYRSLRDFRVDLEPLTIITGANGSGKSSLYRALRLLADVAQGRIISSLAAEGGLASVLWAGPETISREMRQGTRPMQGTRRQTVVALKLGFASDDYGFAIDLGLPAPPSGRFVMDPEIKAESLWTGQTLRLASEFARRAGPAVHIRDGSGAWRDIFKTLAPFDSMLTHCGDPRQALELLAMRERMRAWRFYDHFRTDADAPARRRQIGTRTPVLAGDGADLAATVATILEIGDPDAFAATIDDAFPGSDVAVAVSDGLFELTMTQSGLLRPLRTAELSDGTLRYLLLVAALLSPRPPELMILNEPETSLHPDLLPPLARLIARASTRSQIIVVSHAAALVAALTSVETATRIVLEKRLGETIVAEAEQPSFRQPSWIWPTR